MWRPAPLMPHSRSTDSSHRLADQQSQQKIADMVEILADTSFRGVEHRRDPRYVLAKPVLVQPADGDLRPCGEARYVVARDISRGGMAILSTQAIEADYLIVRLTMPRGESRELEVALRVIRCERIPGGMYDIGGQFTAVVDSGG
jgi:hypothetical protein